VTERVERGGDGGDGEEDRKRKAEEGRKLGGLQCYRTSGG